MTLIQIILVVFFIFALSRVIHRFRVHDINLAVALAWSAVWIAAGVAVVLPQTTFYLARLTGVGRGADVIVYVSIAVLVFIVFHLVIQLQKLDQAVTKLTRELALKDVWKKR